MDLNPTPLRATHVEVHLGQLGRNLKAIRQKIQPAKVMPVVKANAYGHGLLAVARYLLAEGADYLAVAVLDEGLALRRARILAPVLVLGGIHAELIPAYLANNLILTVTSHENLVQIEQVAQQMGCTAQVHIKVDTGMGRLGAPYYEAESLLEASLEFEH